MPILWKGVKMNLLEIVNQCCVRCGDPTVRSATSNEDNSLEWFGYVSQAAVAIPDAHNWSALTKDFTFITSGNKDTYPLPDDFDDMGTYNIYNLTNRRYIPCAGNDKELWKQATHNISQSSIRFRIMGGNIVFTYPIEDGLTLKFTYMSNKPVKYTDSNGVVTYKENFSNDDDTYLLDNELLILKAIALRAKNLGLPEAQLREQDYQERLESKMVKDGGNIQFNMFSHPYINKTTPVDWNREP